MVNTIGFRDVLRSSGPLTIKIIKLCDLVFGAPLAFMVPPKEAVSSPPSTPSRILVIRPGGMGDAVFLLPILKSLRQNNPPLIIDILCEPRNAEVFTSQPSLVNHVFLYPSLKGLGAVFRASYDIVIDTEQWHYASALVGYFLTSPLTVGFATRPLRRKLFNRTVDYNTSDYELKNFLALFSFLLPPNHGITDINGCLKLSDQVKSWARQKIPRNSIALSIGASIPERRLGPDQIRGLIEGLLARHYCPVLLGGNDVIFETDIIMRQVNDPRVTDLVGETSLQESAALIEQSQAFIGPDSGLMHLACAVGTRVIAIFGPGHVHKWSPRGKTHRVISRQAPCSPCTLFGYGLPLCRGFFYCIKDIHIDDILKDL